MNKRIVITGISLVTPLGTELKQNLESLKNNRTGIKKVSGFSLKNISTEFGGEISEFAGKKNKWIEIFDSLLEQLLEQKYVDMADIASSCFSLGSVFFGINNKKHKKINIEKYLKNKLGFTGHLSIDSNTCAAGNYAIKHGADMIASGYTDIAVCGSIDILSSYLFAGFDSLRTLSTEYCKPFSNNKDGLSLGEGGALLVLENLESARKRGAEIFCEYAGFGASCDISGITSMDETGEGIEKCFYNALECLDEPKNIDCISSHGTGTKMNDNVEEKAVSSVFGKDVYIEAVKSYTGHCMGASSSIEAAFLALKFTDNEFYKILNIEEDVKTDINLVQKNLSKRINTGLNNAFGFGGVNSCLVLKRFS